MLRLGAEAVVNTTAATTELVIVCAVFRPRIILISQLVVS